MNAEQEDEEEAKSPGVPADLIKSYLAFGMRAVRKRRWLAGSIFGTITVITIVALAFWPRTWHCDTVVMVAGNQMFQETRQDAMSGAAQVITSRENLEVLVKRANLVRDWNKGRTAPFLFKDKVMAKLRGPMLDKDKEKALIGVLPFALQVNPGNGTLTLSIDWQDPDVAAHIVGEAQQIYLESRHSAEVATMAEYIGILEGHAVKVHDEIDQLAAQINKVREDRMAEMEKGAASLNAAATAADSKPAPVRRARPAVRMPSLLDDGAAGEKKQQLEEKQRQLKDLADNRTRRLTELQAKMLELKTRFTGAHPEILALQRQIDLLSAVTAPEEQLKADIAGLKLEIAAAAAVPAAPDSAGSAAFGGSAAAAAAGGGATTAEPISAEIMKLMQDTDETLDPAVAAQLRFAVEKYAMLRGKINGAKVDLDTAQAAFKHRYRVVVPAEPPNSPIKPKPPVVIGAGLALGLLLALAICLLLELRTGMLVESWQLHQIGLPVLAELRLPPRSFD